MKLATWIVGVIVGSCYLVNGDSDKILLKDGTALTFFKGRMTSSRRTNAIPQLKSTGGKGGLQSMRCTASVGQDERDIQWICESLSCTANAVLGEVSINCEGYGSTEDPYILKNSCGATYELVEVIEQGSNVWSAVDVATVSYSIYEVGKLIGKLTTGASLIEYPFEFLKVVGKNFQNNPKKWKHAAKLVGNAGFIAQKFQKGGAGGAAGQCSGFAETTYR